MAANATTDYLRDLVATEARVVSLRAHRDPLVLDWHRQLHTMHVAHRRAEARAGRLSRSLGATIAVLSAIAGTTIFATLEQDPRIGWRIVVGAASCGAMWRIGWSAIPPRSCRTRNTTRGRPR